MIRNARFLVCNERRIIEYGDVYIEDGKIVDLGGSGELKKKQYKPEVVIDAARMAVIPGLVDTHAHVGQTYVRGLIEDLPAKGIIDTLAKLIWFGYEYHTAETVRITETVGLLEMIKNGTTTHLDCHIFPESMAKAARDSGLRTVLCPQVLDSRKLPDADSPEEYLKMTERTIRRWHRVENGRINVRVHPHATYSCEIDYFKKCLEIADKYGVGIGIHMAEALDEVEVIKKKFGRRPVEFMYDIGLLGPKTIGFHCIWLSNEEIKLFKLTDTKVAHNPMSNMKYAFGIARVPEMVKEGITVGLGTDGPQVVPLDMFEVMKFTGCVHKVNHLDPSLLPARDIFRMATRDGAKALGLEKEVGSLEKGKKADVVLLDLADPRFFPLTKDNILSHIVYFAHAGHVRTVIVDGKILMRDRKIEVLNEKKIMEKARPIGEKFAQELMGRR